MTEALEREQQRVRALVKEWPKGLQEDFAERAGIIEYESQLHPVSRAEAEIAAYLIIVEREKGEKHGSDRGDRSV